MRAWKALSIVPFLLLTGASAAQKQGQPDSVAVQPPLEEIADLAGPPIQVPVGATHVDTTLYSARVSPWVTTFVQPRLAQQIAWVSFRQRPAGEFLTALAAASNSVWTGYRGTAVLTDCPGLEEWLSMNFRERMRASSPYPLTFSPGQLSQLDSRQRIYFAQLRPDQQNLIRLQIWDSYASTEILGPEALATEQVYVERQLSSPTELSDRYSVAAPAFKWHAHTPVVRIPAKPARVGSPSRGTMRGPLGELPASLTGIVPPCPKMQHPELQAEDELRRPHELAPGPTTLGSALNHLVRTSGLNIVAVTSMGERPLVLPHARVSRADLMTLIADEMAARWGKLGETYVLLPDPRLEREGIVRYERVRRLEAHLAALIRDIGARGREILERSNYLRPRQLNKEQRFALEKIVRMAVVAEPQVSPRRALLMEDTRLVYIAAAAGRGAAGLELRDRAGKPLVVSQVPLE